MDQEHSGGAVSGGNTGGHGHDSESPALRHATFLDAATEGAIRYLGIPPEETGFIDALDLARWLEQAADVNTSQKGLYWGAVQWNLKAHPSLKDPSRDEQAQLIMDRIKNTLPAKQLSKRTIAVYEASLHAMYVWSQNARAQDTETTVFVDPLMATQDMLGRIDLGARAKWNYRSALLWHLDLLQAPTARDLQARDLLQSQGIIEQKTKRAQGSVVPEKDLQKIIAHLHEKDQASPKGIASTTLTWIRAGLAAGLRPIEWLDAHWAAPDKSELRVVSAKQKIGQIGFLESDHEKVFDRLVDQPLALRTVKLHSISDSFDVDCMLKLVNDKVPIHLPRSERLNLLNDLYLGVKQTIYRASHHLFAGKRRYSLTSFRRQFAANAKAAYGPEATAEMMGHSGTATPSVGHYGKGSQAHARFKAQSMKDGTREMNVSRNSKASKKPV